MKTNEITKNLSELIEVNKDGTYKVTYFHKGVIICSHTYDSFEDAINHIISFIEITGLIFNEK